MLFDLVYRDGNNLIYLHRLHIILLCSKYGTFGYLCHLSYFLVIFNFPYYLCCGQEYDVQHGNVVLPGASTLLVMAYAHYIPHLFIDGNSA